MTLQLIDVFETPYQVREYRELTWEERFYQMQHSGMAMYPCESKVIASITNHMDAAIHMLNYKSDNALDSHINYALSSSNAFQEIVSMLNQLPDAIETYKREYELANLDQVSTEVLAFGHNLHDGQILFHGGYFPYEVGDVLITDRPLSTSFCPQIALRNAEWRGKAFDQGEIHLLVLRVMQPSPKAFIFPLDDELGIEKEVLISAHVQLQFISKKLIRNDYRLFKVDSQLNEFRKDGCAYVIEVSVSSL